MRKEAQGGRRRRLAASERPPAARAGNGEARRGGAAALPEQQTRAARRPRACQQPWRSARTSSVSAGTSPVSAFRGAAATPPSIADALLRCCAAAGLPNRAAGACPPRARAGEHSRSQTAAQQAIGRRTWKAPEPHQRSSSRARLRALAAADGTRGRVGVSAEAEAHAARMQRGAVGGIACARGAQASATALAGARPARPMGRLVRRPSRIVTAHTRRLRPPRGRSLLLASPLFL